LPTLGSASGSARAEIVS